MNQLFERTMKQRIEYLGARTLVTVLIIISALLLPKAALSADLAGPELLDLNFSETAIDVTSTAASVTMTVHITDDVSGFASGYFSLRSPSNINKQIYVSSYHMVSGNTLDGSYEVGVQFQPGIEPGAWTIEYANLIDVTTNRTYYQLADLQALGLDKSVDVTSVQDTLAPALSALSISPTSTLDAGAGPAVATITVSITDSAEDWNSGFSGGNIWLRHPVSGTSLGFSPYSYYLISGDEYSGTYKGTITLPKYAMSGSWLLSARTMDKAGNQKWFYQTELSDLGFPTSVEVLSDPEDASPAELISLSFDTVVNTILGNDTATFTIETSDDLAGFSYGNFNLRGPTGQTHYVSFGSGHRTSGDELSGTYEVTKESPATANTASG